jgi:hypothetical protein
MLDDRRVLCAAALLWCSASTLPAGCSQAGPGEPAGVDGNESDGAARLQLATDGGLCAEVRFAFYDGSGKIFYIALFKLDAGRPNDEIVYNTRGPTGNGMTTMTPSAVGRT